eukprot:2853501-Rhodomonas_salina.6
MEKHARGQIAYLERGGGAGQHTRPAPPSEQVSTASKNACVHFRNSIDVGTASMNSIDSNTAPINGTHLRTGRADLLAVVDKHVVDLPPPTHAQDGTPCNLRTKLPTNQDHTSRSCEDAEHTHTETRSERRRKWVKREREKREREREREKREEEEKSEKERKEAVYHHHGAVCLDTDHTPPKAYLGTAAHTCVSARVPTAQAEHA